MTAPKANMLHIIEGPVGSGKTTFARRLGQTLKTPALVLDDWMVRLFRADKPEQGLWAWYAERKQRCQGQILETARGLLETGHDAIIEVGLLKKDARLALYERLDETPFSYRVYVLDAPIEERWARVQKRNAEQGETFAMDVSEDVFKRASDLWEPPCPKECDDHDVRFLTQTETGFD